MFLINLKVNAILLRFCDFSLGFCTCFVNVLCSRNHHFVIFQGMLSRENVVYVLIWSKESLNLFSISNFQQLSNGFLWAVIWHLGTNRIKKASFARNKICSVANRNFEFRLVQWHHCSLCCFHFQKTRKHLKVSVNQGLTNLSSFKSIWIFQIHSKQLTL